jgi:hypothetical protein
MLKRSEVYFLIDAERRYQDVTYDPNEFVNDELTITVADLDKDPARGILLLDAYVRKAQDAWADRDANLPSLQYVTKIAAIAVRILERAEGSDKLLTTGLR